LSQNAVALERMGDASRQVQVHRTQLASRTH
jgi:hypothetical protein